MKKINGIQNITKGILMCWVIFFHSKIFIDYSVINNFNILFLLFALIISVGVHYMLKKVKMVETLKSME